jgi:hypothetical protein
MNQQDPPDHRYRITVHDDDHGGAPLVLDIDRACTVAEAIDEVYRQWRLSAGPTHRFDCQGRSLQPHRQQTLEDLAMHWCRGKEWTFRRATAP